MKTQEILASLMPVCRTRVARWLKPLLAVAAGLAVGAAHAQQTNDAFANAMVISGYAGTTTGTNGSATLEACETNAVNTYNADGTVDSLNAPIDKTVWFSWTAPASGLVNFDTFGSDYDTVLAVWTTTNGICGSSLTNLTANDEDPTNAPQSAVSFSAVGGKTYYVQVSGYAGAEGQYVLNWVGPPPNDNFANATFISGGTGTTNGSNVGATLESNEQTKIFTSDNINGVDVGQSVWYVWTAPASGNVTFDTIGSGFDTVLAAYTGNNVANLTQLAADDDIVNDNGFSTTIVSTNSQIGFYAVANTTYFIAVYGVAGPPATQGSVLLNWSLQTPGFSAGKFRFTSPTYSVSQRESVPAAGGNGMSGTPGARISVTRVGGAAGKVNVAYSITNGPSITTYNQELDTETDSYVNRDTNNLNILSISNVSTSYLLIYTLAFTNRCTNSEFAFVTTVSGPPGSLTTNFFPATLPLTLSTNNGATGVYTNADLTVTTATTNYTSVASTFTVTNAGAIAFDSKQANNAWDYVAANGVLTFNDYEMTKDIFINLGTNNILGHGASGAATIQVTLNSATLDTDELQTIPPPSIDPTRANATVTVANASQIELGTGSGMCDPYNATNIVNFERSTLRVNRNAGTARVGVFRGYMGGNRTVGRADYTAASTIYYVIDLANAFDDWNTFTLQSGSDYAIPDLATKEAPEGVVDFTSPTYGQVVFPALAGNPSAVQFINIPIANNDTVEFNKDLFIEFFENDAHKWANAVPGNVISCTLTILFDKQPAGAVDRAYNVDHSASTSPPNNANPGANGPVFAVAVQPDGGAIIGGDFSAYDATNAVRIARAFANGQPDASFISHTGLGADAFIDAITLDPFGGILIGGGFSSFNGVQRNGIARLNPDGTLDNALFLPGFGANGTVSTILMQPDGKILIAGNFTTYNSTNRNCIARINLDGTVDSTFDPGVGPNDDLFNFLTAIHSVALQSDGKIVIGGDFTSVDGVPQNYIARLNTDGTLDTSFDTGGGANDVVNAVAVDATGHILVGGAFTQLGTLGGSEAITRLNADGSLDTTFGAGIGANDVVNTVVLQPDGGILLGGIFTSVNQTRRISIARLLTDGTLDTSFMDTAYNQFAGLINSYYNPDINPPNPVYSMVLQPDGNILIGGSFLQVGGGNSRSAILPRSNVARLIGGSTPGPGNISLAFNAYSAAGQATNSSSTISVNRINGTLGPAIATLQPVALAAGAGAATYGADYLFSATPILYGTTWSSTWMLSDGVAGVNNDAHVTILANTNANTSLNLQLTQPVGSDIFFLGGANKRTSVGLLDPKYLNQGGENIPLGVALGQSLSPLNILRNNLRPGTLSLTSVYYTTNENAIKAFISVIRTGGSDGTVSVHWKTVDGSAHAGQDYVAATDILSFGPTITNGIFSISLNNNGFAQPDRYLNLQLFTPGGGATLGTTNAQLVIVDDDFSGGSVSFDGGIPILTTNIMAYGTNENQLAAKVTVTRLGGTIGQLKVFVATSNGTATNGVNYVGFTNQLTWDNGISGPQSISFPVKQDFLVTSNLTVNVKLYGTTVNGSAASLAMGVYTNALVTITNVDATGTLQFSLSSYSFNENGGSATIPIVRTGGTAGNVSAMFSTYDGTAHSNADYFGTNNTITFTNGEMSKAFRVPIIDNLVQDGNRALTLALTNASPTNALGVPNLATLTIVDDETYNQPPGSIDTTYYPSAGFDGPVFALALEPSDGKLLVGGSFTFANGVGRRRIARMNTDGTLDTKFSSYVPTQGASDTVRSIVVQTDGRILVGGLFTNMNGLALNRIARLNYNGSLDSSFNPGSGVDNAVYAMAEGFVGGLRKLYLGGSFAVAGGTPHNGIVRLNDGGAVDTSFAPGAGPNGTVFALAVQTDGKVVIGGDFTAVSGNTNCNHIARLNVNGTVDTTFNPGGGSDNSVHSLAIQLDGRILIGGLFNNVNGVPRNHIARLNTDGSVDASFTPGPGANGDVQTISLQTDTRIVLGGTFTQCNGVTRNYLSRMNPDGSVDPTINFGMGADNFVAASVIQPDGNIIIGGGFLNYAGTPHPYLARIYGGSMAGSGAVQFFSANFNVHETSTNATITVVRTGGTSGTNFDGSGSIIVPYSSSALTAVDPTNYSNVSGTLDFPAGETVKTFTIPVRDDGVVTPDLLVNLDLGSPTLPAQIGNQPTATLTIINDDSTISLSSSLYSVPKNVINGVAPINIIRNGGTNGTATVVFSTTGGTAIPGTDYTPVNQVVTFNPGVTNVIVNIPINNNGIPEGNQTVFMQLASAGGTILSAPTNATLTIFDTVNAPGQLSFISTNYTITEGGGVGYTNVYITVQRVLGSSGTVSVGYTTQDGTAGAGSKYAPTNGVLTFADGEISKTFPVQVRNTTTAEGPQFFTVFLSNPLGGATITSPSNTVVTILNTNIGIAFASAVNTYTEPSGLVQGSVLVNVLRFNNTNGTTTVNYSTTNGTAVAGTHFVGITNATLTFNPGDTVKTITITTLHDTSVTGDLFYTIGLSNPSGTAQLTPPSSTLMVDRDADAGISFYTNAVSVFRNAGYVIIPVICSNTNVEPVSVNYSTGGGSAVPGVDYTTTSGTLSFTNGAVVNYFVVPVLINNQVQTNRTFNVTLSSPTPPGVLVAPFVETVTIIGTNTPSGLSFSTPIIISGIWGTTNADNSQSVAETGAPLIAGQSAVAPIWFQWTAPAGGDGEVALDTIGSFDTNGVKLDTVLAVFTGSNLGNLNQVAANDDLYPNFPNTQYNENVQNVYNTNSSIVTTNLVFNGTGFVLGLQTNTQGIFNGFRRVFLQPFGGPSGLRFNAKAGTTYYVAADTKFGFTYTISNNTVVPVINGRGPIQLSWAYHPAGVLRFASENVEQTGIVGTNGNPMLLYQCAETEGSQSRNGSQHGIVGPVTVPDFDTTFGSYYQHDVNGLLVTVTRVAGSSGRVSVDYATVDPSPTFLANGDIPARAGFDYTPVAGTLIFDDYEMSKTIVIPIIDDWNYNTTRLTGLDGVPQPNRDFMVVLSNPQRDPAESGTVSQPRVDQVFGQALCRILDCDIDPKGPSSFGVVTNIVNFGVTNTVTNTIISMIPTNAVFNFSKANYRVPRNVQQHWGGNPPVTLYVNRMGTNTSSVTVHYRIDNYFLSKDNDDDQNIYFPLQPASDYAVPTPATTGNVLGLNSDFSGRGGDSGTLTFPGGKNNPFRSQPIHIDLNNNHFPEFNKDIQVTLYVEDSDNNPRQCGMVAETTLTVLFDDMTPPAGSVDQLYNPDFASNLAIDTNSLNLNSTVLHPGTDPLGEVYGVALSTNDQAYIVGAFSTYTDGTNTYTVNGIARLNTDGSLDPTFHSGSGVNVFPGNEFIRSVATFRDKVVIGGDFTSYRGIQRNGVARINGDGTLDTTFAPGGGANGTIWSLLAQSDGKVIIGGEFTLYNGAVANHIARLNIDGSLDTTFNASNVITGPVYAMTTPPSTVLNFNRNAAGGPEEDVQVLNLGTVSSGTLTVNYEMLAVPDDMRIFYGTTNVAAGTGVLLFDTGNVSGGTNLVIPFAPTPGLTASNLTIVMNQGGSTNAGTAWFYNAAVSVPTSDGLIVGGHFNVLGKSFGNIARLNLDGTLNSLFDPGTGPDNSVLSLAWQLDDKIIVGGAFRNVSGVSFNRLARLNGDGSIDASFVNGTGADNVVNSITLQPLTGLMYVGGSFTMMNGTHRQGFARLYPNGTVDTTFLDTAYNQFAGLPRILFGDAPGVLYASAIQADGNIIVGGSFQQVGGGQADYLARGYLEAERGLTPSTVDPNLRVSRGGLNFEPKSRDGVRNRSNVARLIGGATAGPGNIGMVADSYAVNKTQLAAPVTLARINGSLGYASANFAVVPGLALSGQDYRYNAVPPLYPIEWEYLGDATRRHSDGLFGANGLMQDIYGKNISFGVQGPASVNVNIINNSASSGNLNAQFKMSNPNAELFYLGGQLVPVGIALGGSTAPLTLIDNARQDGVFSFAAPVYAATNASTPVTIIRTNGSSGTVTLNFQTTTNGSSAILNVDYKGTNGTIQFGPNETSKAFAVNVLNNGSVSAQEKAVAVELYNIQDQSGGHAQLGLTNALVRIINPNFPGYLSFSTNAYYGSLSAGTINFTVTRTVGSKGTLTLQYATRNGTAHSGSDYTGSTNTLTWNNGDVSSRTVSIPLINNNLVGPNKQFAANIFNATLNGTNAAALYGSVTNAIFAIINDNSYGTFQFSSPSYQFDENGGYATITVTRSGSALGSATVQYATADGTAVAGNNYFATNGTLSFGATQVVKSFNVRLINDGVTNPLPADFYFAVALSGPSSGAALGLTTNSLVHIVDASSFNQLAGSIDESFNSSMNASVLALGLQSSGQIVAGGSFTVVNGTAMNRLTRLNTDGSLDGGFLSGLAGADGSVNALVSQTDDRIVVGGSFLNINGVVRQRIARLTTDGSLDSSFNSGAGADNSVFAVAETFMNGARAIYAGGAFSTFNGSPSPGIVRLNNNGLLDSSFVVGQGVNGTVYAVAAYPTNSVYNAGKVLVGGQFTNYNGAGVANLMRLNQDGSLDTNFSQNATFNNSVRCLAIQLDGGILVGGDFTNVNSTAASHIARLNPDGTLDGAFTAATGPGINGTVNAIVLQADNRILVAGQFSSANGVTRQNITRLLPSGAVDPNINFGTGANGGINAAVIQPADGMMVLGGDFTQFNGEQREHIVRLFGGSITGSGGFQFTAPEYQIDENANFATISVQRTGGTSGTNADGSGSVFVAFTTTNGSAKAGINYTYTTNYLEFPVGEVLRTIFVPVIDDQVITTNLTAKLILSNPTPGTGLGDHANAVLTIINDNSLVKFFSPTYTVPKNTVTALANIGIVRIGSSSGSCTVNFTTGTNGTAVIGTDYYPTNGLITFSPGQTNRTIQIAITNNLLPLGNRTVTMMLTNAVNTTLAAPSNAVLTIQDTVVAPGNLFFTQTNFTANASDGLATITVARTNGTSGSVSVTYSTTDGTALAGNDYVATTNSVTFNDGDTNKTFTIALVNNTVAQSNVQLTVSLSNPTGGAGLIAPTNAILTIFNTNSVFRFALATNTAAESDGFANVVIERLNNSNVASVNYATTDGTAVAGINFAASAGTLNFGVGEMLKSISIPLINHSNVTDLAFGVILSNPVHARLIPPTNTVVILQAAAAGVSFDTNVASVLKNAGAYEAIVVCSNPRVEPLGDTTNVLKVAYTTVDGSAKAGINYQAVAGTLVFTNGITTNKFLVPIFNNQTVSSNLSFSIMLTNVTAPGRITPYGTETITIVESNPGFRFSQSDYKVFENGVNALITVYRTGFTDSIVAVDYVATNGTAIAGQNFYPTNGTLLFTNGVTSQSFNVPIIANSLVQPNLFALLSLSNPTNISAGTVAQLVNPSAATLTIIETGGSYVVPAGSTMVTNFTSHVTDGIIGSNDTVQVLFAFRDSAGLRVTNLVAYLIATNGVTAPSPASQVYGPLEVSGHAVSRAFTFTAQGTNSFTISPTFKLYDNGTYIGPATFTYSIGAWTASFANTNMNIINDNAAASLYPSIISVSGLGNTLIKATITITNLSHNTPGNIDALVVSPTTNALIMAHAGGPVHVTHVNLTFDDAATNSLPQNGQIVTGTNKPTQFYPVQNFP